MIIFYGKMTGVPVWISILFLLSQTRVIKSEDYNVLNRDGSYDFAYRNPDSFHNAQANRNNIVSGQFGGRNPKTGAIDTTSYTAGPRGFRPRGKNIARKYDFSQSGSRPIGSPDDPYFDPNEDPSYNFAFRTRTYSRQEAANRLGDVSGKYTYLDDIGERHDVEFIAGKNTGFHVKTPFPDSNPRAYGPLYFRGRGRPYPRGRTSIQRGLDGSYRFVSAGPDQRRTEASDSSGNVRGSYTYLDDKGVQHSVHYIAGPGIGYRVLKNVKEPHLPTFYPFGRPDIIPPDFYDYPEEDVFDTAATGHPKPPKGGIGPTRTPSAGGDLGFDNSFDKTTPSGGTGGSTPRPIGSRPIRPSYDDFGDDGGDLFDNTDLSVKPRPSTTQRPINGDDRRGGGITNSGDEGIYDDGSYKPSGDEGAYHGGTSTRRPSYDNDQNDLNLFDGSTGGSRGESGKGSNSKDFDTSLHIGGSDKGTIVTNVGADHFSVPPGVSVRAHVQAIDLLPLGPRSPSPSEQYKVEASNIKNEIRDQFNEGSENKEVKTKKVEEIISTSTPTVITTTIINENTTKKRKDTKDITADDDDKLDLF